MFVGWGKSRCWKYYWEQDPLSSLASLHRIFILFWELMLSLRRTLSQEAFVRLRWAERAVAEKCVRGEITWGGAETMPAAEGA